MEKWIKCTVKSDVSVGGGFLSCETREYSVKASDFGKAEAKVKELLERDEQARAFSLVAMVELPKGVSPAVGHLTF
ncbi:hypothetical protein FUAX_33170 [Fulvitalea axinellae]|uniref:Uncharacterized protein n=1 Tax=Fulvitalea axinellae TaxID=1182444 RepID=A0AAU9DIC3_9BACT|nr:hypothetical protein FUAX_33170 [Fulvitalea axinellae]